MRLINTIMLAGSFLFALSSCEKDNTQPSGAISYKVDGVEKKLSTAAYYDTDNSILIYGYGPGESISLYIFTHTKLGDFRFANDIDSAIAVYKPGGFVSTSGKLTINSFDGRHINGTFDFKGSNSRVTRNITDGKFNAVVLNFSQSILLPPIDSATEAENRNKLRAPM